ncbi:hypothetical protein [Streptomyces sp. C8S0]|uniref:hypothetical protein n=1 Tax=Streptomyces sp. C8S0 TaxID=2585716 RepID=UPI001D054349|nr:hypothetical protein [Streptomyces sp. C8S0]
MADRPGFEVIEAPHAFSGQGDALACGDLLLTGYGQRTDERMLGVLARELDYEVVPLRTVSPRWYDLDLAVGVVAPDTLAYCPQALDAPSLRTLRGLGVELIDVSVEEAARFALNLVSDGTTVTMTRACRASPPHCATEVWRSSSSPRPNWRRAAAASAAPP